MTITNSSYQILERGLNSNASVGESGVIPFCTQYTRFFVSFLVVCVGADFLCMDEPSKYITTKSQHDLDYY